MVQRADDVRQLRRRGDVGRQDDEHREHLQRRRCIFESNVAVQQRERRGCSVGSTWPLLARCLPSDVRHRVPVPDHGEAHGAAAHVGLRGAAGPLIRLILLPIRVITLVLRRGTARGGGGLQADVS